MDLADVVAELYGLPPQDFTRTRNERSKAARADGDKGLAEQVRRLPKPSTSAWVVNALLRHHPDEVGQVLELGAALREAQADLDGEELRELNRQRQGLLSAVTRQARGLAKQLGQPASEPVAREVEQTLRAAMADPGAAAAVRSGQLVSALSSTGFAPVDVDGAVAVPSLVEHPETPGRTAAPARGRRGDAAPAARRPSERDRRAERALQEARRRLDQAEGDAAAAEDRRRAALERLREATGHREELAAQAAELERRLRSVQGEVAGADREVHRVEREREQAERAADAAGRAVARARERLERLPDE